mmetsp:Transcript_18822/g.36906  ORF Transcript_18822/g.36906 Transcript_18822/m.36906 type:complete len:717 (-) Transcript_18822:22-2172(-)
MPALGRASGDGPAAGVLTVQFRGRREKIRVATIATTLQAVIQDACETFGSKMGLIIDPSSSHLEHRGKKLDSTLPFRFTGLVNNALVDLHTTKVRDSGEPPATEDAAPTPAPAAAPKKSMASSVHIQIRFPNGKAFRGKFEPETTFAEIIDMIADDKYVGSDLAQNITELVFMQTKIEKDVFAGTTLKMLGISSGSAAFRAHVRALQTDEPSQTSRESSLSTPREEKEAASEETPQQQEVGSEDAEMLSPAKKVADSNASETKMKDSMEEDRDDEGASSGPKEEKSQTAGNKQKRREIADAIKAIRMAYFDEDTRTIAQTLLKIVSAVVRKPGDERVRKINQNNSAFHEKVGKYPAAVQLLLAVGFQSQAGSLVLLPDREDESCSRFAIDRLGKLALEVGCSPFDIGTLMQQVPRPKTEQEKADEAAMMADFDPYKTNLTRMAPGLPVKHVESSVERELADLRASRDKILSEAGIPERKLRIFKPEGGFNARNFSADVESSGDSGEGRSDIGLLAAAAKAQQQQRAAGEKFSTRAMRELETLRKTKIYTSTLLRVQFPDRVILQAYFSPQEKISEMYKLLSELLIESLRSKFELYVTPPLQTLSPSAKFEDSGLVPAALVHLRWTHDDDVQNYLLDPSCLTQKDKAEASTHMEIDTPAFPTSTPVVVASREGKESKTAASDADFGAVGASAASSSSSSSNQDRSKAPNKPKWMKLK